MYDLIHPDDIDKVRDQLSPNDSNSLNRVLDLKTGTVKKESHQSTSAPLGYCMDRANDVLHFSVHSHAHELSSRLHLSDAVGTGEYGGGTVPSAEK